MRIFTIFATVGLLVAQSPAPDAIRGHLESEVARVRQDVARFVLADQRDAVEARIGRAERAVAAGRMHLAFYELEPAWEAVDTGRFIAAHKDVTTGDAFQDLWSRTAAPKPVVYHGPSRPALVEAMAAATEARAPVTYRASLPFAADADVSAGIYYLGDAYAGIHFAEFARRLPWAPNGSAPDFRSIAPELDAFDRQVTAAYEGMDGSQHTGYILTSAAIKEARALDAERRYAGALFKYLMARYRFGLLHPSGDAPSRAALDEARHALPASRDNSIADLFVEMAEAALSETDATARASASIVIRDVLPAYGAAVAPRPATTDAAPAAQTTITLVRWPYT